MKKTPSQKLQQVKLTGDERFTRRSNELDYSVQDFWRWCFSDLTNNTTRGILAEFIVAKAIGIDRNDYLNWDNQDLIFEGKKIEVKSSAFIQSWHQDDYSKPSFDIAKRTSQWDVKTGKSISLASPVRPSDIYVFALLESKTITDNTGPLNLDNWLFYVVNTIELDKHRGDMKNISLIQLEKLGIEGVRFEQLLARIQNV